MNKGAMGWIALILVVVGAVNWGLVGAFNVNLVTMIFGDMSMIGRLVYILVGLAGIYMLVDAMKK